MLPLNVISFRCLSTQPLSVACITKLSTSLILLLPDSIGLEVSFSSGSENFN